MQQAILAEAVGLGNFFSREFRYYFVRTFLSSENLVRILSSFDNISLICLSAVSSQHIDVIHDISAVRACITSNLTTFRKNLN